MPALKCTCPECNLTFDAPASAGPITCPICDTEFAAPTSMQAEPTRKAALTAPAAVAPAPVAFVPTPPAPIRRASRVRSEIVEDPAGDRKRLLMRLVAAGLVLFIVCGIGMGYYVVKALQPKTNAGDAQAGTDAPPPLVAPPSVPGQSANPTPIPEPAPQPPRPLTDHERKVNASIDKGVSFLKKELSEILDGKLGFKEGWQKDGVTALVGLTLLECGVSEKDPLIQRAAQDLRSRSASYFKTYVLSLMVLFFDRLGEPGDRALIQSCAMRLTAGQKSSGCWSYDCNPLSPEEETKLIEFLRSVTYLDPDAPNVKRNQGENLPNKLRGLAVPRWQRGDRPGDSGGDNSNTQFAVLGLWVAQRHGLPMQPALTLVDRYFRRVQNDNGSFGYVRGAQWCDSMTCAGLLGLAAGRGVGQASPDGQRARDPAIEKGLKFLGTRIDTGRRPQGKKFVMADSLGDLYYLWSLERVAMIFDLDTIAGKDWYAWASKLIVEHQNPDGSWEDTFPGAVDTCFALLVLKRVNVAKDLTSNIKKFVDIKNVR